MHPSSGQQAVLRAQLLRFVRLLGRVPLERRGVHRQRRLLVLRRPGGGEEGEGEGEGDEVDDGEARRPEVLLDQLGRHAIHAYPTGGQGGDLFGLHLAVWQAR